jgi:hypothetical protein
MPLSRLALLKKLTVSVTDATLVEIRKGRPALGAWALLDLISKTGTTQQERNFMSKARTGGKGTASSMSKASHSVPNNSFNDQAPGSDLDNLPAREEKIAKRAYELYEQGGYQNGYALTHWLQAEREVVSEPSAMVANRSYDKKGGNL